MSSSCSFHASFFSSCASLQSYTWIELWCGVKILIIYRTGFPYQGGRYHVKYSRCWAVCSPTYFLCTSLYVTVRHFKPSEERFFGASDQDVGTNIVITTKTDHDRGCLNGQLRDTEILEKHLGLGATSELFVLPLIMSCHDKQRKGQSQMSNKTATVFMMMTCSACMDIYDA